MSDLDIGMNDWVVDRLAWDDTKVHDRGKVLTAADLDALESYGRYRDVDGDGIPYRTLPGTHPSKGAFFTRGTSHDEFARYTEDGTIHARVLDRITRKFETAAGLVPKPEIRIADPDARTGLICFGGTRPAVVEALDRLGQEGIRINMMRLRGFPFSDEIRAFCARHDRILVVEQNRDAQMRTLLIVEAGIPAEKLMPVLSYDGTPLAAATVLDAVRKQNLRPAAVAAE